MLDSLLIRNFRLFKELKLEKLGRVNLFTGKNNSGKSCLLEAVYIYASKANPLVLREIISYRDEDWKNFISRNDYIAVEGDDALAYLFHGYHFPEKRDDCILIGAKKNKEKQLRIYPRIYQLVETEDGRLRRIPLPDDQLNLNFGEFFNGELLNIEIGLELQEGNNEGYFLTRLFNNKRSFVINKRTGSDIFSKVHLVSTKGIGNDKEIALWDNISLTDMESEVIACLQLIEKKVSAIALIGEQKIERFSRNNRRIPVIRCEGISERIPLRTMGDGMLRLFHIILAMVNAKDGFLLIDEFENGLHWHVQPRLWDIIFKLSEKLNVQVFATTHSRDCAYGFQKAWTGREAFGTFYRLDPANGDGAVAYSCETLSDALTEDVEFR